MSITDDRTADTLGLLHAVDGQPYDYGGAGSAGRSYDCSGIDCAVVRCMLGDNPPQGFHDFSTESWRLAEPAGVGPYGMRPGLGPQGTAVQLVFHHGGGGPDSHTEGFLWGKRFGSNGAHGVFYDDPSRETRIGYFDATPWYLPNELIGSHGNPNLSGRGGAAPPPPPTGGTVPAPLSITQGMGPNPNGSQIIDSDREISAAAVKAAGYRGRQWYLARPNGGAAGGSLTPGRWHEYNAAGLEQGLNYERDTGDWMADGYQAGVDAGHWIADRVAELRAGGVQGIRYVHLSADSHFNDPNALARVLDCLRGAQSVIGPMARAGYGFLEFIDAARNAGLVDVTWQCGAKSDLRPGVQVYQRNNDNDVIAGVTVDCNDVMAPDWGQINPSTPTATPVLGGLVSDLTPDEQHEVLFALRDIRMQLCGSQNPGEFPGFGQLGVVNGDGTPGAPRTVVDALGSLLNVPNPYSKQLEPAGQALGFLEQRTTGHTDYWGKQIMAALASNPAVSPDVKAAVLAQLATLSITLTPKAV